MYSVVGRVVMGGVLTEKLGTGANAPVESHFHLTPWGGGMFRAECNANVYLARWRENERKDLTSKLIS